MRGKASQLVPQRTTPSPIPQEESIDPTAPNPKAADAPETSVKAEDAPNLAVAIQLMTDVLRNRDTPAKKAKAKEPDTFDGSDSRKLNNFILLCNLYFRNNSAYDDDSAKVN